MQTLTSCLVLAALVALSLADTTCKTQGCKYVHGAPCQCNSLCDAYHDCCPDFKTTCGGEGPPSPPHPHPHPSPNPPPAPGGPKGGPEQVHLALTQDPTAVTVSFATSATYKATPTCTMGSASKKYAATFKGVSHTYTDGGWVGLLHTVVLSGLSAATKYYYSCDGVSEFSFTSPKKVGSMPVTVGIIADLGEACSNSPGCGNSTISALGKAAAAGDFDVLVHAGDIAYTSGAQAIWDEYMREIEPAAAAVPYQVCAGNHEHYYNFSGYINRFAMASEGVAGVPTASKDGAASTMAVNNLFHSVDVGGVHLLGFSTEKPHFEDPAQLAFLKRDLQKAAANRGTVPWIVAYTHHPLYCSTNDFYDCQEAGTKFLRPVIEPLLVEFGVDLFFAGHLHNYERTYPLLNGTVHGGYQNATATVHAVVGMAGCDEGLTNTWMTPSPAWSAVRTAKLGYGRFTAHDRRSLTFEYVSSVDGSVFDNFTLTKDR